MNLHEIEKKFYKGQNLIKKLKIEQIWPHGET